MKSKVKPKPLMFLLLIVVFIAFVLLVMGLSWIYFTSPVNKNDDKEVKIVIDKGTSTVGIGKKLKENNIIKSELFFKLYIKLNNVNNLKASTYRFKKSMSLSEVIELLEKGHISNEDALKLTFKPGGRITEYAKVIGNNTDTSYEDVIKLMKDKTYIKSLINDYWFLTDSILNENIYYPLEGYLTPDTYYFNDKRVDTKEIIERMLDETEGILEDYKSTIEKDPHYYMTMASIVQLEGTTTENRKQIVGVFINRMEKGYNLGSDVTTYYALQADMKEDLDSASFSTINPYNTRAANMIGKMPVGPICNPGESSIEASVNPDKNDYLFFVADKHGKIYFTKTNAEHDKKVAEIKANGDWIF